MALRSRGPAGGSAEAGGRAAAQGAASQSEAGQGAASQRAGGAGSGGRGGAGPGGVGRGPARWSGRRKLLALGVVVVAVAGSLSGWLISSGLSSSTTNQLVVGGPAPAFSLPSLYRGAPPVSLSEFSGKPVVLNFFASWCPPCRTELPSFATASRSVSGRVQFVGVDVGDTSSGAHTLVSQSGVSYPIGVDPGYTVAGGKYELFGMPTTVFIRRDGTVAGWVTGQVGPQRLHQWLARLEQA